MDGKGFLDKGQQAVLEQFFKEEKIWYPDYWYLCFAGGLMLAPAMFLFIMPFQIWEGDYTSVLVVLVLNREAFQAVPETDRDGSNLPDGVCRGIYAYVFHRKYPDACALMFSGAHGNSGRVAFGKIMYYGN